MGKVKGSKTAKSVRFSSESFDPVRKFVFILRNFSSLEKFTRYSCCYVETMCTDLVKWGVFFIKVLLVEKNIVLVFSFIF